MLIPIAIQLLPTDDFSGAKLWAQARDGTGRAWFKRYKNPAAGQTSSALPSAKYSLGVLYANVEDIDLAKYWTKATPPEMVVIK